MKIIVVDDECIALNYFLDTVENIFNRADIICMNDPEESIKYVELNHIDMAFIDVEMPSLSGIELAKAFHNIDSDMGIVFVSAYPQYAINAYEVDGIGYILKPYTTEQIKNVMQKYARYRRYQPSGRIYIRTFGGFDIYVDEEPIHFSRSKAKEMLALMIDRKGSGLTSAQIAAYLWEDRMYDSKVKEYLKKAYQCLRNELRKAGVDSILKEAHNYKSIVPTEFKCDYYDFLNGDKEAVRQYLGDYMCNYSWAEITNGELYHMKYKKD